MRKSQKKAEVSQSHEVAMKEALLKEVLQPVKLCGVHSQPMASMQALAQVAS